MALIKLKPTSPGARFVVRVDRSHLHKGEPYAPLTVSQSKTGARNHSGRITTRHKGGGSRQKYRIIDFKRDKDGHRRRRGDGGIRSEPHRAHRADQVRRWRASLHPRPQGRGAGDDIRAGADSPIKPGNAMALRHIPVGSIVHNVELKPGKGGQIARSAGGSAQFTRVKAFMPTSA